MTNILLLNGPNLDMLGQRETDTYGSTSLKSLEKELIDTASSNDINLISFQSNSEAELIEKIHHVKKDNITFILFNPAAFTHTSIALRDALLSVDTPFIEVHISNIYKRESFRHKSYFSDIAYGIISGLGLTSYRLALQAAIAFCQKS
ncbi:type II 3-dehydroquinate dehydratase [Thiotrichales bacterium 19S9-12]|nr:type II 3-dehydroquinate dehydratase [Thiotrichales bacterium 19S9-11]MCF6811745.1 type II 3-dehydroquinate dehydratase [Thiotrichales bacterium 19S9-12]